MPKYPEVKVDVDKSGPSGNAYVILYHVVQGLKKIGVSIEEVAEFIAEARSGDYKHLLEVCKEWVDIFIY